MPPQGHGPENAPGIATQVGYGLEAGRLLGLPVVTDAAIPTTLGGGTEDVIVVIAADEHVLWETDAGAPFVVRMDEPGSSTLTVRLLAVGYSAFSAGRRPKATATVGGSGLVAPTF